MFPSFLNSTLKFDPPSPITEPNFNYGRKRKEKKHKETHNWKNFPKKVFGWGGEGIRFFFLYFAAAAE